MATGSTVTGNDRRLSAGDAANDARLAEAIALHQRGQFDEAAARYAAILAVAPAHFGAMHLLGVVRHQQGRHRDSVDLITAALRIEPNDAAAHANLGLALRQLGRADDALASHDRALALNPGFAQAHNNRGNALRDLGRHAEALASYDRALALKPDYVNAIKNRGDTLLDLNRPAEALASYDAALALAPDDAGMGNDRGIALGELGRHDEAVAAFDGVLARNPDYAEARANRANALLDLKRYEDAAACFATLVERAPDYPFARGQLLHARMLCCDWAGFDQLTAQVRDDVRAGRKAAEPFGWQGVSDSPADLKRCAEIFAAAHFPPAATPLWRGERYAHDRIRLGYLSGEFRQQATSILMAGLFEAHDRDRFELVALDNGWDDGSAIRARLAGAFDEIVDIGRLSDADAAALIRRREIDVLVNLNGYFGRGRQGVFARRPAPVQVNYLGFPGTLGVNYMGYLVADAHVIPPGDEACYSERIVRLPDCYQANDRRRPIADATLTRAEAGFPETGFVFCCFNNNYKIVPEMFALWMRLLSRVEGSVLWLFEDNPAAARNLRREAERRGVAPARLVFAPRLAPDAHLARHRLADLFVDTLPYNAHTTASDALWAGLPVLTCTGSAFAGRVAGSLLHAAGLPELVTGSLAEYEALALRLATTSSLLAEYRARLAAQRASCPLFDTDRFRRHMEAAYVEMVARQRRGEPPAGFDVAPIG